MQMEIKQIEVFVPGCTKERGYGSKCSRSFPSREGFMSLLDIDSRNKDPH